MVEAKVSKKSPDKNIKIVEETTEVVKEEVKDKDGKKGKLFSVKIDKANAKKITRYALNVLALVAIWLLVDLFVQYLNNDYSIAVVNGTKIPRSEFVHRLEMSYGEEVENTLVEEQLVRSLGKDKGIKVTTEEVDAALKKIEDRLGGNDKLTEALALNHATIEELRYQLENDLIVEKIIKPTLKYTEEDLNAFFEQYKDVIYPDTKDVTFADKKAEIEEVYVNQKVSEGRTTLIEDYKKTANIQLNFPDKPSYGLFKATINIVKNLLAK